MNENTIVKFIGCSESQHNFGNHTGNYNNLVIGKEYVVEKTEVHSWHTKVYLKGIVGNFNSVCFEKLFKYPSETNIKNIHDQ